MNQNKMALARKLTTKVEEGWIINNSPHIYPNPHFTTSWQCMSEQDAGDKMLSCMHTLFTHFDKYLYTLYVHLRLLKLMQREQ